MKKLKKSLLVVPALGVLMLAAAGSVGGTVAWFSSVNSFQTEVSQFAVGRVDGDLVCNMEAGHGTIKVGNTIQTGHMVASVKHNVKLTHGSFNHKAASVDAGVSTVSDQIISTETNITNGVIAIDRTTFLSKVDQRNGTYIFTYKGATYDISGSAGYTATGVSLDTYGITLSGATPSRSDVDAITVTLTNKYATVASPWLYKNVEIDSAYWYHAISWTMTFSYTFGADVTNRNLYLNVDTTGGSALKDIDHSDDDATKQTMKGFRIAFCSTSRKMVWAPEQNVSDDLKYVSGVDNASAVSGYDAGELCSKSDGAVAASTDSSGSTGSTDHNYLGTFTGTAGQKVDLEYTCVAWFEGSDSNVVNASSMDTFAASLKFFTIDAAA